MLDSDNNFQIVGEEIDLGWATNTRMKMSYNGKLFALLTKTQSNQTLKIYKMDENIAKIPGHIRKQPDYEFEGGLRQGQLDIGFIDNMKFDNNDKYFIGCGPYNLFIFELETEIYEIYNLPLLEYDFIFHMRFESLENEDRYRC